LYNKITSKKKKKGGVKTMDIKKRKYSKEQKEEMVQKALNGKSILVLGKENNISPGLINRWRRQYLDGELSNNNDQEVKKLETQVAKLEQMIGKLTMENYILKKEKEYLLQRKKEDSSIFLNILLLIFYRKDHMDDQFYFKLSVNTTRN
jgi:transposase-like protein